ncbi:monooxygenase family protein [Streptomyces sp. NPDC056527]|uniref:monooxygenase family protein n=1 Tax=Streptomyces sp. NPDC056527 TaxID=3345853 RepID=UPI00369AABB7
MAMGSDFTHGLRLVTAPEWNRGGAESRAERRRVRRGRFMAANGEPVAVFLIGARVNRWRSVRGWLPLFMAMPGMIKELRADPESGFLGYRMLLGPSFGEVTIVQYWRKAGDIRAYAAASARRHRPAQSAYWRRYFASNGAVGIWHEMYSVRPGAYHALYGDMPPMGVGALFGLEPAVPGEKGGYQPSTEPIFAAQVTEDRPPSKE